MKGRHGRDFDQLEEKFLEGIGEPSPSAFVPSPFQEEALRCVLQKDTIVVAPTGSGKTWIAEQAIRSFIKLGKECWYTTPLKALSNQKYDYFKRIFGEENVGLLTGERKENPTAFIIVATTEILRNSLYGEGKPPDFVVLDEAHYIADPERGVTWEEIIILSPSETRLLLLSATISNSDELAEWMGKVRGEEPSLIRVDERPVPLRYGFLHAGGWVLPLREKIIGKLGDRDARVPFNPVKIVSILKEKDLIPVIVFLPRRRDCDEAVRTFRGQKWIGRERRMEIFAQVAEETPVLWDHPLLEQLIDAGVAPHHAGHLTGWKVAVERMLSAGLIQAVFATTTLAAGLDVPARTVALPTVMTRDESGTRLLTPLEFHQMSGRAGRRGKDRVGFVIFVPREKRMLYDAVSLSKSPPEPLKSAFSVAYYQILSLLGRHGLQGTIKIFEKSLLFYQMSKLGRKKEKKVRNLMMQEFGRRINILKSLGYLTDSLELTEDGEWACMITHASFLYLAEFVRRGLYRGLSPAALAGTVAALIGERSPRRKLALLDISRVIGLLRDIWRMEKKAGIYSERPSLEAARGRASCVYMWASGAKWQEVVELSRMEEGDLQRLILQTAEALHQLEGLSLPISSLAKEAKKLILREPVI
ncbi:MAG: DEAD/DEAH box helicase [Candidatus Hadarchaeales archaeon]